MSSNDAPKEFNKLLIRNMRRRFKQRVAHVPDEEIIYRHRYITQVLNTNLSRDPQHLKYLTGWKAIPDEFNPESKPAQDTKKKTPSK